MRTRPDPLAGSRHLLMPAVFLVGLAALGCSSPTGIDARVERIVEQEYRFACRAWWPGPPPVSRTLFDLRLSQIDTATEPAPELVWALQATGGRVVHRFHGPMVRVELDVADVPRFAQWLNSAVTVADPEKHDVSLIVLLDHDLTAGDLRAVEALGGRVTHEFHGIEGYVVVIDDVSVPAVRILPGVKLAGFDGTVCLD